MRKKLISVLLATVMLLMVPFVACGASDTQVDVYEDGELVKSVVFVIGVKQYFVNGQTPGVSMDVAPYIDSGRTFVPVRYLGYALGIKEEDVDWDGTAQKASLKKGDRTVELVVGRKQVTVNGAAKAIDVAPQLKSGRTFLPARYVAEGLGYQVKWDAETQAVICWPEGEPEPDITAVLREIGKVGDGVLDEADIKRLQGYAVFDRINPEQSTEPDELYKSFQQMWTDERLRRNAELVVRNFTLEKVFSGEIRERTVTPDGHVVNIGATRYGFNVLSSLKEYRDAELEWLTDPRLVYETALGEYGIRGILLLTFHGPNKFGLTPGQTYEQDVEFRVKNTLDWDTGEITKKLDQIVLLSDFRPVRR